MGREEVELLAEPAVVALLGLLEHLEVGLELGLAGEGVGVDAGEHRLLLVAVPVGARDRAELEGVGPDLAGARDVGAAAEVEEAVLLVGRDGALEGLDELELEGLVGEELARLVLGDFLADELGARAR